MEIQTIVLKKIPIKGTIKEENFRKRGIPKAAVIPFAVGSIMLGAFAYHKQIETNKNLTFSSNYGSYSEQIEELFDVDISEDNEKRLNQLEVVADLINEYHSVDESNNKKTIFLELVDKKKDTEDLCLRILKEDIAKENGGEWDEYTVWQEHADMTWWATGHDDTFTLQDRQDILVDAIGNCQILGDSSQVRETSNPNKIVDRYEKMVLETARFVKNISKKI